VLLANRRTVGVFGVRPMPHSYSPLADEETSVDECSALGDGDCYEWVQRRLTQFVITYWIATFYCSLICRLLDSSNSFELKISDETILNKQISSMSGILCGLE
jgi:hypothetical protein